MRNKRSRSRRSVPIGKLPISKDNKKLKAFARALAQMDQESHDRRNRFLAFLERNQNLPCLERAQAWLKLVADDLEGYGDQEAVVYLVSRGEDCTVPIQEITERWNQSEHRVLDSCRRGTAVAALGGKTSYRGGMPLREAKKIAERSPYELQNFWSFHRTQELAIEATMLRTVQWCGIGGFEGWWKRLARQTTNDLIEGGAECRSLVYWLFAMCRSDFAVKMMPKALNIALDNLEIVRRGSHPWTDVGPTMRNPKKRFNHAYSDFEDFSHAATLIFANCRLRASTVRDTELLESAAGLLQKYQTKTGGWPYRSNDKQPAIEATAMAMHALAFQKPTGWLRNLRSGADWLQSRQEQGGYWVEESSPDPVFLTVLVLDALELASGGSRFTFGEKGTPVGAVISSKPQRKYRVALSFPGEARPLVEPVADILRKALRPHAIFYDNYYKHLLSRPDLDLFLQSVYHEESDLLVVWVSSDYAKKEWCCNVEWPAIRDVIKQRRADDVMFLSLDEGKPKGFLSNFGYIDVRNQNANEIAEYILNRLEANFA